VKSLFDSYPDAKIAFSGSSTLALQAGGADLSRRAVLYFLPGLSFREYLMLAEDVNLPPLKLTELLDRHPQLAAEASKNRPILSYFADYLDHGVYPYFLEGTNEYLPKLLNVLEKVFYEDIPLSIGIKTAKIPVIKKMLWLMATSQPFTPNIDKMSRELKTSKEYVYTYLEALERARLISGIPPAESGYRMVRKPSKIYLENTNLLQALAGQGVGGLKQGTVRETFFAQQLKGIGLGLHVPQKGDFLVAERYTFEIGGKSKSGSQVAGQENAYLVRDDIEVGHGTVIPLWLFGFLY
jgi:predicted AAA+ superfamily ATPase